MPRPPRVDQAGGLYHALNRANAKRRIFGKPADYEAFERVLAEGLQRYQVELFCFQLMPNHWHFVLRPAVDGEMSRFLRWVTATHTMRYHAHYRTGGEGHVYQGRFKSFPIQDDAHFLTVCRYVERNALRAELVGPIQRGQDSLMLAFSLGRLCECPDHHALTKLADCITSSIGRMRNAASSASRPITRRSSACSLKDSRVIRSNSSAFS